MQNPIVKSTKYTLSLLLIDKLLNTTFFNSQMEISGSASVFFLFSLLLVFFPQKKYQSFTKRGDYYNNLRRDEIRGKMVHVRNTRSPATPSTHDPSDPELIPKINTTQEPRGTPAKVDTICTPPRAAAPWPPPDTSRHSHPSKSRPPPDPPSLISDLVVTQSITIAPGN